MKFDPGVAGTARRTAHQVLEQLQAGETAAVVYTFRGRNQNFTTDRGELARAIDSLGPHPAHSGALCDRPSAMSTR